MKRNKFQITGMQESIQDSADHYKFKNANAFNSDGKTADC